MIEQNLEFVIKGVDFGNFVGELVTYNGLYMYCSVNAHLCCRLDVLKVGSVAFMACQSHVSYWFAYLMYIVESGVPRVLPVRF